MYFISITVLPVENSEENSSLTVYKASQFNCNIQF